MRDLLLVRISLARSGLTCKCKIYAIEGDVIVNVSTWIARELGYQEGDQCVHVPVSVLNKGVLTSLLVSATNTPLLISER